MQLQIRKIFPIFFCNFKFLKKYRKKKIHFNYVIDEIQSLVMNPFNQYFLLSCVTGVLLADSLKDSFYRFNCKSKGPSKNLSNEEYLNNFIAKPEIKKKLTFFIDQIRNQNKYKCKGLKITRGLLLYGPPGTGKTLIARVN